MAAAWIGDGSLYCILSRAFKMAGSSSNNSKPVMLPLVFTFDDFALRRPFLNVVMHNLPREFFRKQILGQENEKTRLPSKHMDGLPFFYLPPDLLCSKFRCHHELLIK